MLQENNTFEDQGYYLEEVDIADGDQEQDMQQFQNQN